MPAEPLMIYGDMTRLVQVLQNLLDNASKFTPAGGLICLELSLVQRLIALRVKTRGGASSRTRRPGSLTSSRRRRTRQLRETKAASA